MKTIITALLFLSLGITSSLGQNRGTHQIDIGYHLGSDVVIVEGFANVLSNIGNEEEETISVSSFNIGYKNALSNHFMLGGNLAYDQIRSSIDKNRTATYFTLAVESDYRYISKPNFQMYSGLGIGITFVSEESVNNTAEDLDRSFLNGQLSLLGFRFGKNFAGFAEFGFGYKGLINLGISFQF